MLISSKTSNLVGQYNDNATSNPVAKNDRKSLVNHGHTKFLGKLKTQKPYGKGRVQNLIPPDTEESALAPQYLCKLIINIILERVRPWPNYLFYIYLFIYEFLSRIVSSVLRVNCYQ